MLKYCELYEELRRKGQLIPDADLLIAATAIANNLTLASKDEGFKRLKNLGLKLELRSSAKEHPKQPQAKQRPQNSTENQHSNSSPDK